ncbi:peritrophin-1 [Biomphalaria glabrata]|nr:peritrophin-1 [Biomphalaria glabrata]
MNFLIESGHLLVSYHSLVHTCTDANNSRALQSPIIPPIIRKCVSEMKEFQARVGGERGEAPGLTKTHHKKGAVKACPHRQVLYFVNLPYASNHGLYPGTNCTPDCLPTEPGTANSPTEPPTTRI